MIDMKQHRMQQSLLTAVDTREETIISTVKQVEWIDPLLFYAAGRKLGYKERFYWSDPTQRITMAGIGSVLTFTASSKKRFREIQNLWEKVSIDHSPYAFGTGPLLFGGFTFDPLQEKTETWNSYSDSTLWLPSFMITLKDGEAWLTINKIARKDDHVQDLNEEMKEEVHHILQLSKEPLSDHAVSYIRKREGKLEDWVQTVTAVQKEMEEKNVPKVVLAREMKLETDREVDSANVLEALRIGQPGCYVFAVDYNGSCFLGATPERLVKKERTKYTSMCLAGSIGRGKTAEEDERNAKELLYDEKNRIEHGYVVDSIRKMMEEVCENIVIPQTPGIMKTKHLIHLYTPVEASGTSSLLTMVEKLHPTPALGGTPRNEAMKMIRQQEQIDRGLYGGPIGWLDCEGNGEFAVGIRSGLIKGNHITLFAGCGIVADSKAGLEYEETKMKFKPMLTALGGNTE